jgi:hypothetical protein
MKPGRKRRVTPKAGQLTEGAHERVLRELAGQICVSSQPKGESKDPSRVRVIEIARRDSVPGYDPSDQVGFAHLVRSLKGN